MTRALRSFLQGVGEGTLWLLGLLSFAALPWLSLEYYDGTFQTTWVEWVYVFMLPLLLWRHFAYCKRFDTSVWRGLSRLFKFSGLFFVVWSAVVGTIILVLIESDMLFDALSAIAESVDVSGDIFTYGASLLVVYLSAPNGDPAQLRSKAP